MLTAVAQVGHIIAGSTLPSKGHPGVASFRSRPGLAFPCAAACGQAFPSKPMRIVVPFTPAGAVDIATRATANEMTKILGQPVAVENKPGAGGNLGVLDVARSAPDGYSMVMSTSGIQAINPALYAKMPLDVEQGARPGRADRVAQQRAGGASVGAGAAA